MAELANDHRFSTRDPEAAQDWLSQVYGSYRSLRLDGPVDAFRYDHRTIDCGSFTTSFGRHGLAVRNTVEPIDDRIMVVHVIGGGGTLATGSGDIAAGPGDVFAIDASGIVDLTWSNLTSINVRMSRAAFSRVASDLTGAVPRFDVALPRDRGAAQRWRQLIRYANEFAGTAVHTDCTLATPEVFRLLVASTVESFPAVPVPDRTGVASTAAVRRAVEFMQYNAGSDIDLVDIAAAAAVGPRALQRAFRRTLDTTPLAHLRTLRLQRAHAELATQPPGATVASIARRWGFHHAGRFAADYQRTFGVTPQQTLRPHRT